jgi:hypothetical protein
MSRRSAGAALKIMNEPDDVVARVTDRYERRLAEECGKLRVEQAELRADMNQGLGELRADMNQGLGQLRADMNQGLGQLRADMNQGLGDLRADMIHRNTELLKWGLVCWGTLIGAMAALLKLLN